MTTTYTEILKKELDRAIEERKKYEDYEEELYEENSYARKEQYDFYDGMVQGLSYAITNYNKTSK